FVMDENVDYYNFTKLAGFSSVGIHDWNVSCGKSGLPTLFAMDDVLVEDGSGLVPEFGGVAFLLALVLSVGVLLFLRKSRG
ncbi:MAG: hypothetical protein NTW67_04535, partial [Candidatus Woesearchaeota archaeon]|nr:hypothetical protein [Candidatus Woesearchaeota archaeon]